MTEFEGLIIDSFAGGGGASTGIEAALGRSPDYAINHDEDALAMHAANHPATVHLRENVWKVDPHALVKGREVGLLWASPDCRHHSKAKGGAPVSRSVRGLADIVILWAKVARPRIIMLENVEEFEDWGPLDADGRPCAARKGLEFARWVRALEAEGYAVEWRQLRACDHGAPTIRKRLFLVARRDGHPILWPTRTHGDPKKEAAAITAGKLKPWRTAAEIIDWSLPCPSIFLTKEEAKRDGLRIIRPLADKTLARIARGFKRYVLDRAEPFVVSYYGEGRGGKDRSNLIDEPLRTATTENRFGLVAPHLMTMRNSGKPHTAADEPAHTVTAGGAGLSVVEGALAPFVSYAQQGGASRPADAPHHTVCANAKDQNQVVTAALAPFVGVNRHESIGQPADKPLPTITANSFIKRPGAGGPLSAVTGYLVPRYGEREGQEPRALDAGRPMPTIVPTGNGGDLAAVYLAQHNGGVIGRDADTPAATVTVSGAQIQPVAAYLAGVGGRMGQSGERPVDAPYHTVCTKPDTVIVLPHLTAYYGTGDGNPCDEPIRTATTHDRFGHVEGAASAPPLADWQVERAHSVAAFLRAQGVWDGREADGSPSQFVTVCAGSFMVWDIGMRMLTPRELARAQGFPDSYILAAPLPDGGTLTETAQRHKIGNSVCPPLAEAMARANCVAALKLPKVKAKRANVPAPAPQPRVAAAGLFGEVAA
jgi:DNA (cytosine-5)-methyltransferase 1